MILRLDAFYGVARKCIYVNENISVHVFCALVFFLYEHIYITRKQVQTARKRIYTFCDFCNTPLLESNGKHCA